MLEELLSVLDKYHIYFIVELCKYRGRVFRRVRCMVASSVASKAVGHDRDF